MPNVRAGQVQPWLAVQEGFDLRGGGLLELTMTRFRAIPASTLTSPI
jgi:hypothetical protein